MASGNQRQVPKLVEETVADAYYRKEMEAPTAARGRAQNAYAIAAAVAAAVITAGAFTDLSAEPLGVRLVGIGALLAWLLTAGLFMYAVSTRSIDIPEKELPNSTAFVEAALRHAVKERETIDRRQSYAKTVAVVASALTVVAVALALFIPAPDSSREVILRLNHYDRAHLSEICGQKVTTVVTGTVDGGSLDDGTIAFDPDRTECRVSGTATLQETKTIFVVAP